MEPFHLEEAAGRKPPKGCTEGFAGEPPPKAGIWLSLPPHHADSIIWGDSQVWPKLRLIPETEGGKQGT